MGLPDDYTDLPKAKKTNRYQSVGNSWAAPVVRRIGKRLVEMDDAGTFFDIDSLSLSGRVAKITETEFFVNLGKDLVPMNDGSVLNCTPIPETPTFSSMQEIVSVDAPEDIYISPVGCHGILRRKDERNLKINPRLEEVLLAISGEMHPEEIEKRSRAQPRGRFSASFGSAVDARQGKRREGVSSGKTPLMKHPDESLSLLDFVH